MLIKEAHLRCPRVSMSCKWPAFVDHGTVKMTLNTATCEMYWCKHMHSLITINKGEMTDCPRVTMFCKLYWCKGLHLSFVDPVTDEMNIHKVTILCCPRVSVTCVIYAFVDPSTAEMTITKGSMTCSPRVSMCCMTIKKEQWWSILVSRSFVSFWCKDLQLLLIMWLEIWL